MQTIGKNLASLYEVAWKLLSVQCMALPPGWSTPAHPLSCSAPRLALLPCLIITSVSWTRNDQKISLWLCGTDVSTGEHTKKVLHYIAGVHVGMTATQAVGNTRQCTGMPLLTWDAGQMPRCQVPEHNLCPFDLSQKMQPAITLIPEGILLSIFKNKALEVSQLPFRKS